MITEFSKNLWMHIFWAINLGGVKVGKFMIHQIFDKTEDGMIKSTSTWENLKVFVNKNRLAKASADSSLIVVIDPSGLLSGPIVCLIFCFCLTYAVI